MAERAIPHPRSMTGPAVTMSIGLATALPSASNSIEDLIAAADQALYDAKSAGRDRLIAGQRVTGASRRT